MGWTNEFMERNQNHFTVYMHINKINNKKYIGITGQTPKERWRGGNGYYRNKHFYNSIQKYGWDNFEHKIIAENLSKEEAIILEKKLIAYYETSDRSKGYNIGLGGEGVNSLSNESREKIRQANIGRKFSDETKKKISESRMGEKNWRYGVKLPDWHKEILLKANIGKKLSSQQIEKIIETEGYITLQYDMQGNYLNSFVSTTKAANFLGIHPSGIKACCDKRIRSNHNFIFRYEKDGYVKGINLPDEDIIFANYSKNKFKIYQCDENDNIIKEFLSCTEAGKELHIDRHDISKCIKGLREFAGGYKWKKVS